MKQFSLIKSFFLVVVILAIVVSAPAHAQPPKALAFGTSSMGSAFYAVSVVMANAISKKSGVNLSVEPVGGSDATVRGLIAKKVELAMLNANTAFDAYTGAGTYAKSGKAPIALIAQGQDSLRQIVARADSRIMTIADLADKKFIARRRANIEMEKMADILLELYGVDKKRVKIIETVESNETADALKVGSVDAAVLPGGLGAGYILDLAQSTDLVFLQIPEDKMDALVKRMGSAFHVATIPANTYRGQTHDLKTLAMAALLVCRADLDEDTVYKITKGLFTSYDEIKSGHASGADWNLQNTLRSQPIPFHPGAIRYFREAGVWSK
jgi:uncharacterized protein